MELFVNPLRKRGMRVLARHDGTPLWEVNDIMDTAAEAGKPAGFAPFDYEHEHDRRMHAAANLRR